MAARATRWWSVALMLSIALNTAVMWSDRVGAWWAGRVSEDEVGSMPGPFRTVIDLRAPLGDADLHAVAWGVSAVVAVMVITARFAPTSADSRRPVGLVLGTVWAWSVTVEVLQPVVSDTRAFEWIDVVGNTVGIAVGGGTTWAVRARRAARAAPSASRR